MIKILYRILRKIRILKLINLTTSISINSTRINVPLLGEIGFGNLSLSEVWMCDVLKTLPVSLSGIFVDVGINIGQTLIKLKSVYPNMGYVGFEPNPICINYTNSLIRSNDWQDTKIIPVGINDASSVVELHHYTADDTDSCASIIPDFRNPESISKTTYVPCYTVNDLEFIFTRNIAIIKIDVEGAELEVIRAFNKQIIKQRPFLLCEILPPYTAENLVRISRQDEILKIFQNLGYFIYRIQKNEKEVFIGFKLIEKFDIHSNIDWCDYVFAPTSLKNNVIS